MPIQLLMNNRSSASYWASGIVPVVFLFAASTCLTPSPSATSDIPYEIREPDVVHKLPSELKEISGLTTLDTVHVAAVQDEKGMVYVINVESGKIVATTRFAGGGDYEALEKVGDEIYVLRSDGDLFVLSADFMGWEKREPSRRIKTELSRRNDAEGLSYSAASKTLLILCKEYPGKRLKKRRAAYEYHFGKDELSEFPVVVVASDSVNARIDERVTYSRFKPSAIAHHPISGNLYMLSSPNRLLIVLESDGTVKHVGKFKKEYGRQPEGLTFLSDGTMVMASEGAGGRATMALFKLK